MNPQPKATPYRSKKYLLFVASHRCCMCGSRYGVVPHHSATGGMGTKCGDDLCVPLCFRCHEEIGSRRKDDIPGLAVILAELRAEYDEVLKSGDAAWQKKWHEAHKSEQAAYREAHKSKTAARMKEYNESHKSEEAARKKKYCEALTDYYVSTLLGLPVDIIPPEILELKRNRIRLTRELVILKKAIKGE